MFKGDTYVHLGPNVPYSPNQFFGWDLFCRFLQQTGSRHIRDITKWKVQVGQCQKKLVCNHKPPQFLDQICFKTFLVKISQNQYMVLFSAFFFFFLLMFVWIWTKKCDFRVSKALDIDQCEMCTLKKTKYNTFISCPTLSRVRESLPGIVFHT